MSGNIGQVALAATSVGAGLASTAIGLFSGPTNSMISYLMLDVLTTENLSLPSDVTKYPIEDGSGDFTDHITAHNEEIKITGMISSATSFGIEFGPLCYSKMIDAIDQLRKMHKARTTVTVVTGLGKYEDMAFTDMTIDRSNSANIGGQWLTINVGLRKIIKVTLQTTDLPPEQNAASDVKGKTGKTEQKVSKSDSSNEPPASVGYNVLPHGSYKGY
jgi:hypothetical protein